VNIIPEIGHMTLFFWDVLMYSCFRTTFTTFKENEMNPITTSRTINNRGTLHILQTIFTVLALVSLAIGSVILSVVWLGNGSFSLFGIITGTGIGPEGKFFTTIFLLLPTLFFVWLLSTVALLIARRWVTAGLALPTAIVVLIGFYLFMVFVMPTVPDLVFVLLLIMLNGGALWLARWFLTSTSR